MILLYVQECVGCVFEHGACVSFIPTIMNYVLKKNLTVPFATSEGRCWFMCYAHLNLTPFKFKYKVNLRFVTVFSNDRANVHVLEIVLEL